MIQVLCLTEQRDQAAWSRLPDDVAIAARPLADLLSRGWEKPLLLMGSGLLQPDASKLLQRTYRNAAPLLILPPLPPGEMTSMLNAAALAEKGRWLQPYCVRRGLRFCPRRQIEWFGLARGT